MYRPFMQICCIAARMVAISITGDKWTVLFYQSVDAPSIVVSDFHRSIMENTYNDLFVRCRNLPTPREQQTSISCHCHLVFQCIATLDNAQTEHSLTSVLSFVCIVCVNSHQRPCVSSQHLFGVELFIIGKNRMRLCFDLPKCLQSLPPQLSAAVRR